MSGTPNKRLHEEGGGHSSTSKYPHDDPGMYPKLTTSSATNEYHNTHFDTVMQDARMPKIPRSEARDAERRSPLLPPPSSYRMSSLSLNDSHSEHPVASENRNELRDYKDNISSRDFKVDTKVEPRELYQGGKGGGVGDKDIRFDISRGDDNNKETKYAADYKVEQPKDGYNGGGGNSHFNWKELKEQQQHRGKRYPPDNTPPGGNVDLWQSSSRTTCNTTTTNLHNEVGKEGAAAATAEEIEAHEAVGENKVDIKGGDDNKLKEKDRKRKDGKQQHREWGGERDKERSSDHRSSSSSSSRQQLGNSSNESPPRREEREPEKWERERKDLLIKEKDKSKDRENDHTSKREVWSAVEKEGLDPEKDDDDDDAAMMEQENSTLLEPKKHHDSWKNNNNVVDSRGEANKERRKERDTTATTTSGDVVVEGERPERRSRCYDKESDDGGCVDAEGGVTERERGGGGVFNYGVQQRKRMLRPRGSPQVGNRDPRFRSRTPQDNNEWSQGKPDVSTVVYRVGECMQELIKSWKEYESQADKMGESSQNGPTLEIRIPAEHVTATNRQVRGGQLWGTDIYTDDSDLVAVLMHTGYCRPTASPPPPAIQELRATIKVLPPQDCYISTLRNNVRSRAWGAAIGCSYIVQRCCIVKKGGGTIDLEPCLTHTSAVEPTLAPVVVERTMTTRAAASNALRQQRFVREVTIQYNLCNEPWIKYSISAVADKGLKKPLYTSARLKKGEVLYLESHSCRFELCFNGEKVAKATIAPETEEDASQSQSMNNNTTSAAATTTTTTTTTNNISSSNGERSTTIQVEGGDNGGGVMMMDVFRWSRCKKPLPQKVMHSIGIPLPIDHLEILEENVEWEDIQWSQAGVWITGKEYPLVRVHFLSPN